MGLSRASAYRLSLYLRALDGWPADAGRVSSGQLAGACGGTDAQVRKDLAGLGQLGQRGLGYDARELAAAVRAALGIDRTWRAVLVGAGNLARALLRYRGFKAQGFEVVGLFDADPGKVGTRVEGLTVEGMDRLGGRVAELGAEMGVVAVPVEAAQGVTDALAAAGVRGVLNFAPVLLRLPPRVRLVTVDLTIQFEQLAYLIRHGGGDPGPPAGG